MPEDHEQPPAGGSVGAFGATQAALASRHEAAAEADRAVAAALARAHATTVESVERLDAIAADIDAAVANQVAFALETAVGAREFRKFLLAKQQEITEVVSRARDVGVEVEAALDDARAHYTQPVQN